MNMGTWLGNANTINWVQRRRHLGQSQQCIFLPPPPAIGVFTQSVRRRKRQVLVHSGTACPEISNRLTTLSKFTQSHGLNLFGVISYSLRTGLNEETKV
ncbi:unnamed protein product, partial [Nesidiocoris tenuis]